MRERELKLNATGDDFQFLDLIIKSHQLGPRVEFENENETDLFFVCLLVSTTTSN